MKPLIAIIDYGMGNLRSIFRGLEYAGARPEITNDPEIINGSNGIVIPGVGAFQDAMENLVPLKSLIEKNIDEKPVLGVCLGLQMFFTESHEDGVHKGLDLMKGRVVRFSNDLKVPHMGWNSLKILKRTRLLEGVNDGDYFYFVHSYYAQAQEDVVTATTNYGIDVPAVVEKGNVFATQFHPEKSGKLGLRILENFVEIANI